MSEGIKGLLEEPERWVNRPATYLKQWHLSTR
jgi:hypothetical protein